MKKSITDLYGTLAICFIAILLSSFLNGCGNSSKASTEAELLTVTTAQAVAGKPSNELRLPARAAANQHVMVHARATGIVVERRVDLGDNVVAGDVLVVIHAPEVDQAVHEADAERSLAQANLILAQTHYERARKLIESGAISRELHDDRQAAWQVAQASLAAASARLYNLREQKAFQQVRAPISGVITARNIEQGDRVIADQGAASTPLFELSTLDPLRIVVDVPQSALPQMQKGRRARVEFIGFPDAETTAEVVRLAQRIDGATGGMRVELLVQNPEQHIRPGMMGYVEFSLPVSSPPAQVPTSAVIQSGSGDQVIVVDSNSTLEFRAVRLGRNLGDQIEVVAGIVVGERVVLTPNARFKPGTLVKVKDR